MHFPPQDAALPPAIVTLVRPKNDEERKDRGQRAPRRRVKRKVRVQNVGVVDGDHHGGPAHHQRHLSDGVRRRLPKVGEKVVALARPSYALGSERLLGHGDYGHEFSPFAARSVSPVLSVLHDYSDGGCCGGTDRL